MCDCIDILPCEPPTQPTRMMSSLSRTTTSNQTSRNPPHWRLGSDGRNESGVRCPTTAQPALTQVHPLTPQSELVMGATLAALRASIRSRGLLHDLGGRQVLYSTPSFDNMYTYTHGISRRSHSCRPHCVRPAHCPATSPAGPVLVLVTSGLKPSCSGGMLCSTSLASYTLIKSLCALDTCRHGVNRHRHMP